MDDRYCKQCGTLQEQGRANILLTRDSLKDKETICNAVVYYCNKCNSWEDYFEYIYDCEDYL